MLTKPLTLETLGLKTIKTKRGGPLPYGRYATVLRWIALLIMLSVGAFGRRSRAGVFANMPHPVFYRPGWSEAAAYCRTLSSA